MRDATYSTSTLARQNPLTEVAIAAAGPNPVTQAKRRSPIRCSGPGDGRLSSISRSGSNPQSAIRMLEGLSATGVGCEIAHKPLKFAYANIF